MHQSRFGDLDKTFNYYRTVNFNANRMGIEDLKHIAKKETKILTSIKLEKNGINAEGMFILSQVKWINLTQLRLNSNLINSKGCKFLTRGQWPLLDSLSLDLNMIQKEGLLHLSKNSWSLLKAFSIDQNYITTFEHIKFRNQKALKKLNFDWNPFIFFGVQAFLLSEFSNTEELILRIAVFKLGGHALGDHLREKFPKFLVFSF